MLVIRKEQLSVLRAARSERFDLETAQAINARVPPGQAQSFEDLRPSITRARQRAREYTIFRRQDVQRFIVLLAERGWDFAETTDTDWAQPILRQTTMSGARKLDALERMLVERAGGRG
jgi:hypothetical protein